MKKVFSKSVVSKKLFVYISFLLFLLVSGFFLSSYIIFKSFHYSEVINYSGKVRGDIQRFAKLYFAGDRAKLPIVAEEINECVRILEKQVNDLKLPLIDKGKNFKPTEVIKCWRELYSAILKDNPKWSKEKILTFSENCWKNADKQTNFYQSIAERNVVLLNFLYFFIFVFTILIIALLLKLNFSEVFKKLEKRANYDALTGILNRGALEDIYATIIKDEFFYPISLIIFDLDDFKRVNDTYGHTVGDVVLKKVAKEIKRHLRRSDLLARWGGEEFVIILPHTDLEGARLVAEKLRKALEDLSIEELKGEKITASFGVTQIVPGETIESAVLRADKALYRAKELGKNRVETNPPEEGEV
jgi:diguanylate cyclase (GGDEF)-like protein